MSDAQLQLAADLLGPLVDEVVFLGGATVHLWLTDTAAPPARATDDVDVLCDVHSTGDYYAFGERLRERGLQERMNEEIVGRWRDPQTDLAIDVIPPDEDVLGFTNRWYALALERAVERRLESGTTIRALAPAVLVATKLEAWRGRGANDVLRSLDVHDIVVLLNGRQELADEVALESVELRRFVAEELALLQEDPYFEYVIGDALEGYGEIAAARSAIVYERIRRLIELAD